MIEVKRKTFATYNYFGYYPNIPQTRPRCHMVETQPPLSKTIADQERRIGARSHAPFRDSNLVVLLLS